MTSNLFDFVDLSFCSDYSQPTDRFGGCFLRRRRVFYQIVNRKSLRLINQKSIVRYSEAHKVFVLM